MKRLTKNRWVIVSVLAVAIILSGTGYYYYTRLQSARNNKPAVETTTIGTGDILLSATGLGTLVPSQEISFGFKTAGQVSEVLASLGDNVKAGQVLARLESKTLELQYKQAAANVAALNSPSKIAAAEQAVQDAKASFATARDNLQYMIGPEMLIGENAVAEAQKNLQLAKDAVEKDPSAANKQKVVEAQSALTKAEATLNYAYYNYSSSYTHQTFTFPIRNSGGVTIRRDLIAPTEAEIATAHAAYELAQANLNDAQNYLDVLKGNKSPEEVPASSLTATTEAQTALDSAKAELEATELIAPISGTITSLSLNAGEQVGTSAVVTLSNMNQPYLVDVNLDETDWDKAKVGYAASVTFDLLPDATYPGKVTQVYPALDDSSGTSMVHLQVQLDSPISADLPAGATASVDIAGGEALGAVLAPVSALKEVEPGKFIVYSMKNGKPVEQEVQIGLQDILNAEVRSGLKAGDVVLTDATTVNQ
ncbi:MAG TPA: efflux RND transporter periplasmic adaptor subunit [Anaerolineales bacterium]|nr:efflux RND transporter periplasmic adaptor subunit [Anaerolineales bacterium]